MNKVLTSLVVVIILVALWDRLTSTQAADQWVKAHKELNANNWVQLWSGLEDSDIEARQDERAFILVQKSDFNKVQRLSAEIGFPAKVQLFQRSLSPGSLEKATNVLENHKVSYEVTDRTLFVEALDEKRTFHFLVESGELPSIYADSEPSDLAEKAGLPNPLWRSLPLGCPTNEKTLEESFAPYARRYRSALETYGELNFKFRPHYSVPSLDESEVLRIEIVQSARPLPTDSVKALIMLNSDLGILPEQIKFQY